MSNSKHQENLYKKKFFSFAKEAVNGLVGKTRIFPQFSKEQADEYYVNTYDKITEPNLDLTWYPNQMDPSHPNFIAYPEDIIKPKDVKRL